MAKKQEIDDPAMTKVRELWAKRKAARMTQEELGVAMGYDPKSARKSISQFLKSHDPRIGMLRKFAKAVGVKLSDLVGDK